MVPETITLHVRSSWNKQLLGGLVYLHHPLIFRIYISPFMLILYPYLVWSNVEQESAAASIGYDIWGFAEINRDLA